MQLVNQPYEITSATIKYIVDNLNPVCFINSNLEASNQVDTVASGMNFLTTLRMKVGLVVYTCFRVSTCSDFDIHFKAHLKYVTQKLVTSLDECFHIFVLFPIHVRIGEVLQVSYKCGLKPGIRDEGIEVVNKITPKFKSAKL